MVFIIQNAQNRDVKAMQLRLDELLRAVNAAETGFVDLESLDDEALRKLETRFAALRKRHAEHATGEHLDESTNRV